MAERADSGKTSRLAVARRFGLRGKNAIVTGGSTGIGREVVRGLADLGANVVFNSTENSREAAEDLVEEQTARGRRVLWVPGNAAEAQTTTNLVATTRREVGPPHILVAGAGVTMDGAFLRQGDEKFDDLYAIKVDSARRLTQGVLLHMKRAGFGRIVYISSVAGDGSPWQVNYAMANEALVGLAKSVAMLYPDENVSANVVKPALVRSKLTGEDRLAKEPREAIIGAMPIKRILEPVEVADAVLMLVAQRTAAINGQELYVDGAMRRV